jgi:hypothetical protein
MSRTMNFDDMPTRVKTSPARRDGRAHAWGEDDTRASYRKQPKWKEDRHRMNRERMGEQMYAAEM